MVFASEYALVYDTLYRDKDYKKESEFIENIFRKLKLTPKTILDLGCGTASHAISLARRGYEVVGVDKSAQMLKIAKEKAKKARVSIEFIKEDITKLNLQKKFDAIVAMFAVVGYQATDSALKKTFDTAHKHLVPGGIFIFDCWYGPAVLTDKPRECIKEIVTANGEKIVRFTTPEFEILRNIVKVNFKVQRFKGAKIIAETKESHLMRFLFADEIVHFLKRAGFKSVQLHPFLNLDKAISEEDRNVTVVARA
ncbi:MAG: methyltransferase domain-containing protein [Candidatus Omnitrophota bacterium]